MDSNWKAFHLTAQADENGKKIKDINIIVNKQTSVIILASIMTCIQKVSPLYPPFAPPDILRNKLFGQNNT